MGLNGLPSKKPRSALTPPDDWFAAQNVTELAEFSGELPPKQLLHLLVIYNEGVAAVEVDRSTQIGIPSALVRLKGK